jgi:uncharacterized membrane protein YeaQ/YmgE (transglycosylase-associated protein family)
MIGFEIILAVLIGIFWSGAYVLIRGSAGGRLPLVLLASVLGAWAGDALGGRLEVDPVRLGDVHLIAASIGACVGIAVIALLTLLGPGRGSVG